MLSPSSSSTPTDNNKRRLTRARQLRHLRDCDVKHLDFFLNSPGRDRHGEVHVQSQPLPLPELSPILSNADRLCKERRKSKLFKLKPDNSDSFRLPSPSTTTTSTGGVTKEINACWDGPQDGKRIVDVERRIDVSPRVDPHRSIETHRSVQCADTWSSRNGMITRADQVQRNPHLNITSRSAPPSANTSPMVSPQRVLKNPNQGLLSLYHEESNCWSEPPMSSSSPYIARTESNVFNLSHHISMLNILPAKGLKPSRESTGGSALSPRRPKLNIEISSFHNDRNFMTNVHPLPLPPTPSAPQVSMKSAFSPVKNQWSKGKLIGRGTFGSVYVATHRETGALCAMKEVELCSDDPKSAECMRQLQQEIKFLSHLKHPNIVQYYGSEIVDDRFYIYLEYVYPGSINKYVHEHCGAITEAVVRNFTRHICSGLAYLHSRKTIHRDIKGANLLVDSSGVVKLADFGMAKHLTGQAAELSMKGSPYWMAPELMQSVLQKDNRSDLALAVDIWSLGCTIIEMLTGKPPWSEYEGAAAMFKVLKESPAIPDSLSAEGKDFLNCCFRREPADRPSASMLLEHSFLKNCQQLDSRCYNFQSSSKIYKSNGKIT